MRSPMLERIGAKGKKVNNLFALFIFICTVAGWTLGVWLYPSHQTFLEKVKNAGNPLVIALIVVLAALSPWIVGILLFSKPKRQ